MSPGDPPTSSPQPVRADDLLPRDYCTFIYFLFQLLAAAFIYLYGSEPPRWACISITGHVIPVLINVYVMAAALVQAPAQRWFYKGILAMQSLLSALVIVVIGYRVMQYVKHADYLDLFGA
jgi:hypothetical protein